MNIKVIPTESLRPGMHIAGSSSRVKHVEVLRDGIRIDFIHEWAVSLFWNGPECAIVED